ncbi:hypothetical protein N7445_000075 [Penicillium cf. griseofulvum]|nr:hypothetical protein N7445_000075 [Penicillium cf. griseofulvum]
MLLQGRTSDAKEYLNVIPLELEIAPSGVDQNRDHWQVIQIILICGCYSSNWLYPFSIGLTLYWLGNTHLNDGDDHATAFDFHKRALQCFGPSSSGNVHPMFATANYKMGVHYYTHAIAGLLDGKLFSLRDETKCAEYSTDADEPFKEAFDLRQEIMTARKLSFREPDEEIHDRLVNRWYR